MGKTDDPAHGRNKVNDFANRKKGSNKGIAKAKKERKRVEAEARQGKVSASSVPVSTL